jgi:hypothetical protein
VLPLTTYRQPRWNGSRKVLDPMPRWLTHDTMASDRLVIGRTVLAGEDRRVDDAEDALAAATAQGRTDALARLGFGVVVIEKDAGDVPEVAGRVLLDDDTVTVVALEQPAQRRLPTGWLVAAMLAWSAYAGGPMIALLLALRSTLGRARRGRPTKDAVTDDTPW